MPASVAACLRVNLVSPPALGSMSVLAPRCGSTCLRSSPARRIARARMRWAIFWASQNRPAQTAATGLRVYCADIKTGLVLNRFSGCLVPRHARASPAPIGRKRASPPPRAYCGETASGVTSRLAPPRSSAAPQASSRGTPRKRPSSRPRPTGEPSRLPISGRPARSPPSGRGGA